MRFCLIIAASALRGLQAFLIAWGVYQISLAQTPGDIIREVLFICLNGVGITVNTISIKGLAQ